MRKKKLVKKNPVGRPPIYKSSEALQKKIDMYFKKGIAMREFLVGPSSKKVKISIPVPTITGLVLYCGFCDRSSFYKLEENQEFLHTIKKARSRIEQNYEELLQTGLGAGAIFALKNFGWIDEQLIKGQGIASNITIHFHANGKPADSNRDLLSTAQATTLPRG